MKCASIVGCGWVGLALAERWVAGGIEVTGTTTREERMSELEARGVQAFCISAETSWDTLPCVQELLVITIPPGRRYPDRLAVYPERLVALARRVESAAKVIFLSSTSVYGDAKGVVDEGIPPQPATKSGQAVFEAEKQLRSVLAERFTVLRLGGLVGPGRHPGRWFAGKDNVPNGDAPTNLVHRDDVCDAIDAVIENDAFGEVFNVVASTHPPKRDYYPSVCAQFGYEVPTFNVGGADGKQVSPERIEGLMRRRITMPFVGA